MAYNNWSKKTIFPNREALTFKDFMWKKESFVKKIMDRLSYKKDVFIAVTGRTGSGKSHFTANLCFKYFEKEKNFIKNDGSFMYDDDNFIIDPEEFAAKMITNKGSVLFVDEAIGTVDRQAWQSKLSQTIIQRKNRNRKLFNIYFLLFPYEKEINPRLASHLTMWIHLRRKKAKNKSQKDYAIAEIYCSSSAFKGSKGLDIQAILDRDEKYRKEHPNAKTVPAFIHGEWIGRIKCFALTPGYERRYEKLVDDKKAAGELSDDEKIKFGMMENLSPEAYIINAIKKLKDGEISSKKELWETLKKQTSYTNSKLKADLNFQLNLNELPSFAKLPF